MKAIVGSEKYTNIDEKKENVTMYHSDMTLANAGQILFIPTSIDDILPSTDQINTIYMPFSYYMLHFYKKDKDTIAHKDVFIYFDLEQQPFFAELKRHLHVNDEQHALSLRRMVDIRQLNTFLLSDLFILEELLGPCEQLETENRSEHKKEITHLVAVATFKNKTTANLVYQIFPEKKRTVEVRCGEEYAEKISQSYRYELDKMMQTARKRDEQFKDKVKNLLRFFPT